MFIIKCLNQRRNRWRISYSIRDADIVVVMDKGQILESGSHDDLLAQKGKCYELYMTQYAGFAT